MQIKLPSPDNKFLLPTVGAIGKNIILKKIIITANEFLFHKCRSNRKIQKCEKVKYKRYNLIITTSYDPLFTICSFGGGFFQI